MGHAANVLLRVYTRSMPTLAHLPIASSRRFRFLNLNDLHEKMTCTAGLAASVIMRPHYAARYMISGQTMRCMQVVYELCGFAKPGITIAPSVRQGFNDARVSVSRTIHRFSAQRFESAPKKACSLNQTCRHAVDLASMPQQALAVSCDRA